MTQKERQIAVVTGGGSGIGRGTAKVLAGAGKFVVIADINKESGIRVVEEIRARGGEADFRHVDVADESSVELLAHDVAEDFGAADILVNSAGILQNISQIEVTSIAEHDRVMTINYRGCYLCCRAFALQMMARRSGNIINITSTSAVHSMPTLAYGPSKAALQMLTQNLAMDLGPLNIRVNAVMPGYVLTEQVQARIESGQRDPRSLTLHSALGRQVMPEDVGKAILFLCSDEASAITGISLPVDCGYLSAVSYLHHPALRGVHPRREDQEPVF
ncbi:short-chain dehydrogenase [Betaproteobacteria bacterium]|nr:short-chain dehydrogenase [Betaproteobacteria bacterium]